MKDIKNTIIIGSGPAGHTAAIYAARAALQPLMFEGFMAGGIAAGGQLTTTSHVENFPGFPDGIDGPELMHNMRVQSVKYGTEIKTETVESIKISDNPHKIPFEVISYGKSYYTKSIIIATGATARKLGIINEDTFWNKGISACAVCDGALPIFKNKPLAVIGGGDSACEEAHFLTKFASMVYILVRRNLLRASHHMQQRILKHPKIKILWETQALKANGDTLLQTLSLISAKNPQKEFTLSVHGLFYAIGHTPNTQFLQNQIKTNDTGYIVTGPNTSKTSVNGIFACGDVQDSIYRQAITAAGSGCKAALEVEHFLTL